MHWSVPIFYTNRTLTVSVDDKNDKVNDSFENLLKMYKKLVLEQEQEQEQEQKSEFWFSWHTKSAPFHLWFFHFHHNIYLNSFQ